MNWVFVRPTVGVYALLSFSQVAEGMNIQQKAAQLQQLFPTTRNQRVHQLTLKTLKTIMSSPYTRMPDPVPEEKIREINQIRRLRLYALVCGLHDLSLGHENEVWSQFTEQLSQKIENNHKNGHAILSELDKIKKENKALKEKVSQLTQYASVLSSERDSSQASRRKEQDKRRELEKQNQTLQGQILTLSQEKQNLLTANQSLKDDIRKLTPSTDLALQLKIDQLLNELKAKETDLEQAQSQQSQLLEAQKDWMRRLDEAEKQNSKLARHIQELEVKNQTLLDQLNQYQVINQHLRQDISRLNAALSPKKRKP